MGAQADVNQAVGSRPGRGTSRGPHFIGQSIIRGNTVMRLSRRDMFKLGGLAAVGAAGLAIPLGNTVSGSSASLLPTSKMPKPYQAAFERVGVLAPVIGGDAQGPIHYYDIT